MENSAKFLIKIGLIASSLKLNPTQGPFNSWSGVQPVIANMLESLLAKAVESEFTSNPIFPILSDFVQFLDFSRL